MGGVFVPERHTFLRVKRHRHHGRAIHAVGCAASARGRGRVGVAGRAHRVPDEAARTREGEVADVLRAEVPGLRAAGFVFLEGLYFIGRDDENRGLGGLGLLEALALCGGEDGFRILEHARGGNRVIVRHGETHIIVAKLKGEFAGAKILLVLPAGVIGVGGEARKPLRNHVEGVAVLEDLVAGAERRALRRVELVGPRERENDLRSRRERRWQIDAHHRLNDRVLERLAGRILHVAHDEVAGIALGDHDFLHRAVGKLGEVGRRLRERARVGVVREEIGVELKPEIGERIRRGVVISDGALAREAVLLLVERRLDHIVGAILPIRRAGRAGGIALRRGRGQQLIELLEFFDRGAS